MEANMKLIVGLGNPGKEYQNTRHNVGFMVLDAFAKKNKITIDRQKFNGLYYDFIVNDEKVILLKPQSYMNLSGDVIKQYVDYFKIDINDILIIHDDLDIELGNFKLRLSGSSGGHNGLKNIISNLNTEEFKRIKIGISNNKMMDTKDYVTGSFSKEEEDKLNNVINIIVNVLDDYFKISFNNLMNKYNKKNDTV
jgi:PTH1 family peptidyl-tRNA hydrolase